MEIKPPVAIASVVLLVVLLFGGFMWYQRAQGPSQAERMPALTPDQYRGPRAPGPGTGQ
jgi:hypothetical protein